MRYPWILFDADDTLFDFRRSAQHALAFTLAHFKIKPQATHIDTYESINREAWASFERNEINALELRRVRFERFLDAIGELRDPLEMNGHYLLELSRTEFLVEGARELIEQFLEKNYRLGLITNGLKEVQRPRIAQARMESYFQVIVVSDEIGVSKPHSGFFDHAFEQMGQPQKTEVLVVGDSLSSDIQGGNSFGVDTCWYNPKKAANLSGHAPVYEISHLHDLRKIVGF